MTRTEELWLEGGGFREVYRDDYVEQLEKLVRLQQSALEFASDFIPASECKVGECEVCEAIAAFNKFEGGE